MYNIEKWLNSYITSYRLTWLGTLTSIVGLFILEHTSYVTSVGIGVLLSAMYIDMAGKYGK